VYAKKRACSNQALHLLSDEKWEFSNTDDYFIPGQNAGKEFSAPERIYFEAECR
jgi:hypothetical protein